MALSNNTFCWSGLVTSDAEASVGFLTGVFGWTREEVDMGDGPMTLLANDGSQFAHIRAPEQGEPTWWNNYLRVENVDGAAETLHSRGGEVVVPPTDIPPGRFATVKMPSGAFFSFYREANADDGDHPIGPGHVHWVDLHSTALDDDLQALMALGFTTQTMEMPGGAYHLLSPGTPTRGGAMKSMNPQAPSMWLAWIEVESADDTAGAIESKGGSILAPAWDADGVGRMVIARDPVGLVFGVIQPPA
ncbi:MAG: VOC family protein [Nannocystaceae bacterium]|nr:VOC family protein [bacterium]